MSQPGKKRPRLKKLNLTVRERWEKILKDVEKQKIPISLLDSIVVNLIDGTKVNIEVKSLIENGADASELESVLEERLKTLDIFIKDIDFYVSVDEVAKTVQPITDSFLKDL